MTADRPALPAPFLFPAKTMDELTEPERRGEFTLERLRERRPEVIDEILRLRARWVSHLKIARTLEVSVNTVAAVDKAFADPIETIREKQVSLLEGAGYQLAAQIAENPGLVPWNAKALSAKLLLEFAELKAGRATQRIEMTERVDIEASWREYLATLRPVEAMVVAQAPAMGLDGKDFASMAPADRPLELVAGEAGSDLKSVGAPMVAAADLTTYLTDPDLAGRPPIAADETLEAAAAAGGGGDGACGGGCPTQIGKPPSEIFSNGSAPPATP